MDNSNENKEDQVEFSPSELKKLLKIQKRELKELLKKQTAELKQRIKEAASDAAEISANGQTQTQSQYSSLDEEDLKRFREEFKKEMEQMKVNLRNLMVDKLPVKEQQDKENDPLPRDPDDRDS